MVDCRPSPQAEVSAPRSRRRERSRAQPRRFGFLKLARGAWVLAFETTNSNEGLLTLIPECLYPEPFIKQDQAPPYPAPASGPFLLPGLYTCACTEPLPWTPPRTMPKLGGWNSAFLSLRAPCDQQLPALLPFTHYRFVSPTHRFQGSCFIKNDVNTLLDLRWWRSVMSRDK